MPPKGYQKPIGQTKHLGKSTKYKFKKPAPEILDTFKNKHPRNNYIVPFVQPRDEFTSLCPVTSQPDHAKIEIVYVPDKKLVESKSLKLYLFSFRNSGEYHENVINRIFNDLWNLLDPKFLRVYGDFASRGGLAIKPMVNEFDEEMEYNECNAIKEQIEMFDRCK